LLFFSSVVGTAYELPQDLGEVAWVEKNLRLLTGLCSSGLPLPDGSLLFA